MTRAETHICSFPGCGKVATSEPGQVWCCAEHAPIIEQEIADQADLRRRVARMNTQTPPGEWVSFGIEQIWHYLPWGARGFYGGLTLCNKLGKATRYRGSVAVDHNNECPECRAQLDQKEA